MLTPTTYEQTWEDAFQYFSRLGPLRLLTARHLLAIGVPTISIFVNPRNDIN